MEGNFWTTLVAVTLASGVLGLPIYVVFRFLRAYEQRTMVQAATQLSAERWDALEARLEALEAEVGELVEGQRFATAVLTSPRPASHPPQSSRDAT